MKKVNAGKGTFGKLSELLMEARDVGEGGVPRLLGFAAWYPKSSPTPKYHNRAPDCDTEQGRRDAESCGLCTEMLDAAPKSDPETQNPAGLDMSPVVLKTRGPNILTELDLQILRGEDLRTAQGSWGMERDSQTESKCKG